MHSHCQAQSQASYSTAFSKVNCENRNQSHSKYKTQRKSNWIQIQQGQVDPTPLCKGNCSSWLEMYSHLRSGFQPAPKSGHHLGWIQISAGKWMESRTEMWWRMKDKYQRWASNSVEEVRLTQWKIQQKHLLSNMIWFIESMWSCQGDHPCMIAM